MPAKKKSTALSKRVTKKPTVIKKASASPARAIRPKKEDENLPKIKVVAVGGSGKSATNYMIKKDTKGVQFIVVNTDAQDLNQSLAKKKIHIGKNLTGGIGTGMNPEVGKSAALETKEEITSALKDAQMVFITGGMGGGTGTGASPVIASIAREMGILTVGVVTKPFSFEGARRTELAEAGISELEKNVDSYIVIPNDKILVASEEDTTMNDAFALSDEVLKQAVEGISSLITTPGRINVDFADIKTVLSEAGMALVGIGKSTGENRGVEAATKAINSPLLDISAHGAGAVLFSISAGDDLKMSEVESIASTITKEISPNAIVKFGTIRDLKLKKGEIKVTVIASNFDKTTNPIEPLNEMDPTINEMTEEEAEEVVSRAKRNNSRRVAQNELGDEDEGRDVMSFLPKFIRDRL